jgi:hypothetical protein
MQSKSHHGGTAADATFLETVDIDQTSSVVDLHRSNLLRIQANELVDACTISPDKQWVKIAHEYMEYVSDLVASMDTSLIETHNKDALPPFSTKLSDRPISNGFPCKDTLSVSQPLHPLLGLSMPSGNANVLPTFQLRVKIPSSAMEPKDYLRHRYFDVSLYALACENLYLKASSHNFSLFDL